MFRSHNFLNAVSINRNWTDRNKSIDLLGAANRWGKKRHFLFLALYIVPSHNSRGLVPEVSSHVRTRLHAMRASTIRFFGAWRKRFATLKRHEWAWRPRPTTNHVSRRNALRPTAVVVGITRGGKGSRVDGRARGTPELLNSSNWLLVEGKKSR